VGPRASLDDCGEEKISFPLPGLKPRTVQLAASRYTDYACKITLKKKPKTSTFKKAVLSGNSLYIRPLYAYLRTSIKGAVQSSKMIKKQNQSDDSHQF
jgi:hypothetical protein